MMTAVLEQPHPPRLKKWTKEEYLNLVEHGAFAKERVYLFRGDIIQMPPQGHPHAFCIMRLNRYLNETFEEPYAVRIQLPFITPGQSVPEPDGAVCGEEDSRRKPHPSSAQLIVEVAYSSLEADRALAVEYAGAQVPEYWILDADNRRIEVYRNPVADPAALYGYRYSDVKVLNIGDKISPVNRPDAEIPVATFFA